MNSAEILSCTDRTSWRRMAMVARYFWPRFRSKVMIFPLVTLLIFVCGYFVGNETSPLGAYSIFGLTGYLMIFNPLIFTKRSDMEITATLPATGLEKCVVVLAYSFVLMPLAIYAPLHLAHFVTYGSIYTAPAVVNGVHLDTPLIQASNAVSLLAMTASCLWAVMAARTHRVLKGVAAALGVSIINGLTGAVFGFIAAIQAHAPVDAPAELVAEMTSRTFSVMLPLLSAYLILAVAMTCRAICRRQL